MCRHRTRDNFPSFFTQFPKLRGEYPKEPQGERKWPVSRVRVLEGKCREGERDLLE